ncbi:hypothetical protein ASE52_02370 [Acidovorax sp. Root275]|uniref:hypothetical protein n=1 Tax=Acidovorax sp. Root275 TaxID=1736508 RepID=UPI00070F06CC|nr:hypothetical protein [Acidovorax sp. Root275]KRD55145.1 hypothetical protein ASE52_02370 [Acidovorax sp. Root275]
MRRASLAVAYALLLYPGTADTSLAQPSFHDYMDAYPRLQRQEFAQVESLYATAVQQPAAKSSRNGAESFFSALRARSGGAGGNTPEATAAWGLARQWVQASPNSVPAAIFLGRLAVRDAPANRDWAAQERQTTEAIKALDKVREQGRTDPMWNSTYIALQTMGGATPAQTLAMVKAHLPAMSEPGEMFFEDVVAALDLKSTDALSQLKELSELAVQRTAKTQGTGMHAVIYLAAFHHMPALRLNPFKPGLIEWETIDAALTDLSNQRPNSINQVHHAALACLAQDRKRAIELLTGLFEPKDINTAIWNSWGGEVFYQRCKVWAYGQPVPT